MPLKAFTKICMALAIALTVTVTMPCQAVNAAQATPQKLLILNSYNEDEQWSNNVSLAVTQVLSLNHTVETDMFYLNTSAISDQETYDLITDNLFKRYSSDVHPDYIVMVGNFAFALRDRVQQEWGDVPMLLISRSKEVGPLEDYFIDYDDIKIDPQTPLESLKSQYNFTCIFIRDYTSKTFDLMYKLIPNMTEFIFMSDCSYLNKLAANRLSTYVSENHPSVQFKWLRAMPETADSISYYMTHRMPQTGFLVSSWAYETESAKGYPVLTGKDLRMLNGSVNPIFSMRQPYMRMGAIGGVYDDNDAVNAQIIDVVTRLIAGEQARDIPFFEPQNPRPIINYQLMEKYGLKASNCPPDTEFVMRPTTYWEKYSTLLIIIFALALISVVLLLSRTVAQRRRIDALNRHTDILNKMPIPYAKISVRLTPNGRLLDVSYDVTNEAFVKVFDANTSAMKHIRHLHTDEVIEEKVNILIDSNEPVRFSTRLEATNSYYEFLLIPLEHYTRKDSTQMCVFDMFIIDVTQRIEMERKLKESAVSLDLTIQIAKLVPWQWDYKRSIITMSGKFFDDAAEDKDVEISMEEYQALILEEDHHVIEEAYRRVYAKETDSVEVTYRIKSDKTPQGYEWLETYARVTEVDEDGNNVKMLGTIQNITERKQQEEELRAALQKASESDRLKSSFLANMSHEIRTPLNAIVGFSHLMTRSNSEAERDKLAQVIDKNNDLLLTLINDVLDLAKIESNTIDLNYGICDINDLIDSISKTMMIRVPKTVHLNVVQYTGHCIVETDANRVSQVLINLLTNACKFTKKGSITVGYEIHNDKDIYIYVKDTGIGISPENQERVFEQFVKINNFAQGTGLGLAISRSLVEKLGGEIGCTSAGEGRGSLFWFTLPYKPVALDEPELLDSPVLDISHQVGHEVEMHADFNVPEQKPVHHVDGRPTVLVGEDNHSNYWLLEHLLRDHFNLIEAQNGRIALDIFRERQKEIDLIIMDINMPEMDGYESVEEIRKISTDVPIIAVTAYAFASDRARILNSGFDAYVSKPITEHTIFEAISRFIEIETPA